MSKRVGRGGGGKLKEGERGFRTRRWGAGDERPTVWAGSMTRSWCSDRVPHWSGSPCLLFGVLKTDPNPTPNPDPKSERHVSRTYQGRARPALSVGRGGRGSRSGGTGPRRSRRRRENPAEMEAARCRCVRLVTQRHHLRETPVHSCMCTALRCTAACAQRPPPRLKETTQQHQNQPPTGLDRQ